MFILWNHVRCFQGAILSAFCKFCSGSEEHVAGTVEGGFAGIFQYGDNETYTYHLHGNIIADAEGCAGNRNEEQGAAGYAGCTAGTNGRNDAEQKGRSHIYFNTQGMGSSQSQHGMVMDAPAMLMVAPSGMEMVKVSGFSPSLLQRDRFTGMLAAELLVKKA